MNDDFKEELKDAYAEIERLRTALRMWESAINRLSMRVGLTAKDIADELNPIMNITRAALGDEK